MGGHVGGLREAGPREGPTAHGCRHQSQRQAGATVHGVHGKGRGGAEAR